MLTISGSQWFGPMLGTNELVKPKWKWKSLRSAEWTELHLVLIYSDIIYVHLVYPGLTTRDEFTSARLVQRVLEGLEGATSHTGHENAAPQLSLFYVW